MGHLSHKPKVLIFIVAYNASKKICSVIDRIPENITSNFDVSLLIIDDCSSDSTYEIARDYLRNDFWCKSEVLKNPVNLGYGGNQKVGYFYAIQNQFDLVVL